MLFISTKWFGVFLHDGKRILNYKLFEKERLDEYIEKLSNGEILDEEKEIAVNQNVLTSDKRMQKICKYDENALDINVNPGDYGYSWEMLREMLIRVTRKKMERELGREDIQIVQIVKSIRELTRISNLISERIRDWKNLPTHDGAEILEKLKRKIDDSTEELKDELKKVMEKVAPNLSNFLGYMLGAELIAQAGSLDKLAKLPSSSIQILGAEKALFRYKHGKGTPPKHGIIFKHPVIRSAKSRHRGKISRFLALKISVAAKADAFTRNLIYNNLKEELEDFLDKLK